MEAGSGSTPATEAMERDRGGDVTAGARTRVVFVHGLWLHADSWLPWAELFRGAGYEPLCPGWPGDGKTVEETNQHPERLAGVGIDQVTRHHAEIVRTLGSKPIVIGHSFGGLIAQKLLGMGLATAAVAIDPAQQRGVRAVPLAQLKTFLPILANPLNYKRAVRQTRASFHRGFANAVSAAESDELHARYVIPAPGRPLFEAALANLNPSTAARVDRRASRGPLLITGAGRDVTVPDAISRATHALYRDAATVNEYLGFPDRGHSLVIDSGWRTVADAVLAWLGSKGLR